MKKSENFIHPPSIVPLQQSAIKGLKNDGEMKEDSIRVKVVANTANFMDSDFDVLLPNAAKKSISERRDKIPHIADHIYKADSKVGEVADIMLQDVSYSELGLPGNGATQAIVFVTDVFKSYNEKLFEQYKRGTANQHSIGLWYVKVELALDAPDDKRHFEIWEKYRGQIINGEKADQFGFFWAVSEIKLIENSTVLFGANEITPILATENQEEKSVEPSADTRENEPPEGTQSRNSEGFNFYL